MPYTSLGKENLLKKLRMKLLAFAKILKKTGGATPEVEKNPRASRRKIAP